MKPLMERHALLLVLAAGLVLGGVLVAGAAVAQDAQAPAAAPAWRRAEGRGGRTGSIQGLTPEQLPALQPPDLTPLYHFAGALNRDTDPPLATVVQCSNLGADPTRIEVQLYDYDASDVYTGSIGVDPLHTATFESSPVSFYLADVPMVVGNVVQGYGRILAQHDDVVCTVQTVDPDGVPPAWAFDIPVYGESTYGLALPSILNNAGP